MTFCMLYSGGTLGTREGGVPQQGGDERGTFQVVEQVCLLQHTHGMHAWGFRHLPNAYMSLSPLSLPMSHCSDTS